MCDTGKSYGLSGTIDILPDEVLLDIFDFYRRNPVSYPISLVWTWPLLVHVCRRWRQIIFESPDRLNLQILCTHKTSVRNNLSIWPNFPISIHYDYTGRSLRPEGVGNVIAALRHSNRVSHVELIVTSSLLEKLVSVMQEPFPVLTHIEIYSRGDSDERGLTGGFLGGSAPRLQNICLNNLPFLALPTLLSSTNNLLTLTLDNIPPTGYISPEAMVACLAVLPRLENLVIGFQSHTPHPYRIYGPPVTRTVLPALTFFTVHAASEYLEDLVARIDGPQLERIHVDCLNPLVDIPVVQLPKFFDRSVGSRLTTFSHGQARFCWGSFSFVISRLEKRPCWDWAPARGTIKRTIISCEGIGRQVPKIAQVLSRFSAILSNLVHLDLDVRPEEGHQLKDITNAEWLHLLRQFSAVQTLHVSLELAGYITCALEDIIEEVVTDVLPSLELICLEVQPVPSVEKFIAVRRLSGHPVTVVNTMAEFSKSLESYVSK